MQPTSDPVVHVTRVLSNNAVVAVDGAGHEVVALGRGLGHGRRPGDALDNTRIEQVFVAGGDVAAQRLTEFLADTPLTCVRAAAAIADIARERLNLRVTQAVILPLADHLNFAVQRHTDGMVIQSPLRFEVSQLYPAELAVGRAGLERANTILGVELDPDEAVAITLHLINAQFTTPGLGTAMQMTTTIAQILTIVEKTFGVRIDQQSMNTARFVTHLRYLVTRITTGKQIADPQPTLVDAIANAHPDAMACAAKLQYLMQMAFSTPLTPDETAYLALHVARLIHDVRTPQHT